MGKTRKGDNNIMSQTLSMKGNRTLCRTFSGNSFLFSAPSAKNIHLLDIAHHLSQNNRYNGACPYPYSVAQHSLLVAATMPEDFKLEGLMHDAAEALLGDVVRPLKNLLGDYRQVEEKFQGLVEDRYSLAKGSLSSEPVIMADRMVMAREMQDILGWNDLLEYPLSPHLIEPLEWKEVRCAFIVAAHMLALPKDRAEDCFNQKFVPAFEGLSLLGSTRELHIFPEDARALAESLDESMSRARRGDLPLIPVEILPACLFPAINLAMNTLGWEEDCEDKSEPKR